MTSGVPPTPGRDQIVAWWTALIKGSITREEAHAWAAQWVEDEEANICDPMVASALQNLHGFDLNCIPGRENLAQHGMSDVDSRYVHPAMRLRLNLRDGLTIARNMMKIQRIIHGNCACAHSSMKWIVGSRVRKVEIIGKSNVSYLR